MFSYTLMRQFKCLIRLNKKLKLTKRITRHMVNDANELRQVMRCIPQPVAVVTSASIYPYYGIVKRGVTCSSFTSVSLEPSTVSISLYSGNIINNIIEKSHHFTANILSDQQLKMGMHFARPLSSELGYNQFENVQHSDGTRGIPVLDDCMGHLQCRVTKVDVVADHHVWYGEVIEASSHSDTSIHPMLYYQRSFRTIGDELFMQAFEDTSMPFEEWTHEAHLRMAWNYLTQYSVEEATLCIKHGILKLNDKNKDKVSHGYSETVTQFYIHIISKSILSMPTGHTFDDFILCHNYLTDPKYLFKFYSKQLLDNPQTKVEFFLPDVSDLP